MENSASAVAGPPEIRRNGSGGIDDSWVADVIEWFLNYDERTARIRHPMTDELFNWKQKDDETQGLVIFPFENAEARFALGTYQAFKENTSEPLLGLWLNDVLAALHEARETRREITEANNLDQDAGLSWLNKAELLTTNAERRLYLTSCWLETLCTAEARVLGWIYQETFGRPFTPTT